MRRLTISILALLTAFSAMASGALNGRVLCMAGSEHLAIEDPHGAAVGGEARHCGLERCARHAIAGDDTRVDDTVWLNGDDHDAGGCVDIKASGTLVRESAAPSFDNAHTPLPLAQQVSPPPATFLAIHRRLVRADADGGSSPSPTDLVGLRVIVLLT